jgi:hypothetical protein
MVVSSQCEKDTKVTCTNCDTGKIWKVFLCPGYYGCVPPKCGWASGVRMTGSTTNPHHPSDLVQAEWETSLLDLWPVL